MAEDLKEMYWIILNVINNIYTYPNIALKHYVFYFKSLKTKLTIIYDLSVNDLHWMVGYTYI